MKIHLAAIESRVEELSEQSKVLRPYILESFLMPLYSDYMLDSGAFSIVVIQGEHSCMTARGIKKPGVKTKTASCGGQFLVNAELRKEFYLVDSK